MKTKIEIKSWAGNLLFEHDSLPNLKPNADRPIEKFFVAIKGGEKPEENPFSKLAVQWIDQWLANIEGAFAAPIK